MDGWRFLKRLLEGYLYRLYLTMTLLFRAEKMGGEWLTLRYC